MVNCLIQFIGRLPDVIYYQIDGGSENVAKVAFVVSELLVASKLTKKVIVSRLMVGHTHLDLDGKYGVIWVSLRVCDINF